MDAQVLRVACRIIRSSSARNPADQVLRETLKAERDFDPQLSGEVSRAVFSYFRWRGWLSASTTEGEIKQAIGLAEAFARGPEEFAGEELVRKAVPQWTSEQIEISEGWVRALQIPPKLWLRARPGQGGILAGKLRRCVVQERMPETLEYAGVVDLFRTPEFHAGEFEVQDISSQAVGCICAPKAGETWWDACAGEGGKTLHLADLMGNKGLIWASDRAAWRLQKLKRRAARAKVFNYRMAAWDGGVRLPTKTRFDGVLVDAPCSGTGTWQRNPHARWTTTPTDVKELADLQLEILRNAAQAVKPGSKLIYAVCTLTRSETVLIADEFERQARDFSPLEIATPLPADRRQGGRLFLWPQECGGNGMFIAAWTRNAG